MLDCPEVALWGWQDIKNPPPPPKIQLLISFVTDRVWGCKWPQAQCPSSPTMRAVPVWYQALEVHAVVARGARLNRQLEAVSPSCNTGQCSLWSNHAVCQRCKRFETLKWDQWNVLKQKPLTIKLRVDVLFSLVICWKKSNQSHTRESFEKASTFKITLYETLCFIFSCIWTLDQGLSVFLDHLCVF